MEATMLPMIPRMAKVVWATPSTQKENCGCKKDDII